MPIGAFKLNSISRYLVPVSSGRTAKTITAVGNAQISTAQSVFGGSSALFDGTGDYLTVSPVALNDRSSDFTLEARVRLSTLPGTNTFRMIYGEIQTYYSYASIANRGGVYTSNIVVRSPDGLSFREEYMTISSIAANTWYHWAIVKQGNTLSHYWNGTKLTTANFTQGTMSATYGFNNLDVIGRWNADTNNWAGNLDEMRVSNTARYTANFTVPTTPFTNDANTLLLIHADNDNNATTFVDDVGSGVGRSRNDLTVTGNAQIDTAQSKFGGSSMLFDGNTDKLRINRQLLPSTGDYTVDFWMRYPSGFTLTQHNFWYAGTNGQTPYLTSLAGITWYDWSSNLNYTGTLSSNTWYHLAFEKQGTTRRIYINGTLAVSGSTGDRSTTFFDIAAHDADTTKHFNGWMDEFRVSNIARYQGSNFTAPTAPYVNDANTLLLLHGDGTDAATTFIDDNVNVTFRSDSYSSFLKLALPFDRAFKTTDIAHRITGSGLTDSATMTRGANVTMSTSNVKWTSPQYLETADFAPGGNALTYTLPTSIPSSASGTYVIEGWFRAESTGTKWCISSADSGGRYLFSISSDTTAFSTSEGNQNFVKIGTSLTHVAIVCDAGTKRLYQDGIYKGAWLTGNTGFSTLHLGQFNAGDANDYDGQIQDFRVYVGTNKGYTGTNASTANFTLPSSIIESY